MVSHYDSAARAGSDKPQLCRPNDPALIGQAIVMALGTLIWAVLGGFVALIIASQASAPR
ncbi:hypothetical protein [Mycolicibacterium nivoides]|uniref:hypothetical protein n=1 Tax=Mycolicibacterium nivoides TaxID=2487344 RepID=UPI003CE757A1